MKVVAQYCQRSKSLTQALINTDLSQAQQQCPMKNEILTPYTTVKKSINWSWQMFGTFVIMMESLGEYKNVFCLKKVSKSKQDQSEAQDGSEYVLVLDLDETLVHADTKRTSPEDFEVEVKLAKSTELYFVKKRPFLQEFLEKMASIFELVIFTASLKEYADKVIDYIDPNGLIKRRFYRDSCTKKDASYYKDLTKVSPNLEKVLIIDNSPSGYLLNPDNGLLIKSWYQDKKDMELKTYTRLLNDLFSLRSMGDIRKIIQRIKRKYPKNIIN